MLQAFILATALVLAPSDPAALASPTPGPATTLAPSPEPAATAMPSVPPPTAPAPPMPHAATASPHAAATAKEPLKEIGRVHAVTQFCQAFEKHFNAAVVPMLDEDQQTGAISFTLGGIEPHYKSNKAEFYLYDDRVHLMAYVQRMYDLIPSAQREIDALWKSGALATDPAETKSTRALAKYLQKALDRQKQIAYDTQGVIHALVETYDSMRQSRQRASTMAGGYDPYTQTTPPDMRDIRSYLRYDNQLDRISDAEGESSRLADAIASKC